MFSLIKRGTGLALVGLAVLALTGSKAHGQNPFFQIRPGLTLQQAAFNTAVIGQALQNVPPYVYGINPYPRVVAGGGGGYGNPYASLYSGGYGAGLGGYGGGYGGYGYPYYDPNASVVMAGASVISAQGGFFVKQQQAFKMREAVYADRLENRRRLFDEYLYEREKTPTPEQDRQRYLREQFDRSRNNPPVTEIYSAKSLNDLLADLRSNAGKSDSATLRTFQLPLDEAALKHINLSKGTGNLGLLKNEGRLSWPVGLSGSEFKEEREQVNSLAREAVNQASFNGQVDSGTIRELVNETEQLRKQFRRTGRDLPPWMYIEASSFLNNLNDATRALQQPDVGNFISGKYAIKAKTIPELVKFMNDNGLQFAPAVPGDEPAYMALQQSLSTYDRMAQSQTAERR